jgi:hypothetical protein
MSTEVIVDKEQFLRDILCTAAEGGIGYWCDWKSTTRANKDGDYLALHGCHDAEGGAKFKDITVETIRLGIERILSGSVKVRSDLVAQVATGNAFNEAGDIDADGADVIVQAGLFGEIVYG